MARPRVDTRRVRHCAGPIFASRTHGYDTTDHYRFDPRLGDDADFDDLVAQAHQRGLRVLLDGVFNHVGTDFARYREALDGDAAARWFRGRPGKFHTFEGHGGLITLNHDNPEVVDYIADVMAHWLHRGSTAGAWTRLTLCRNSSGPRCCRGSRAAPGRLVRRRSHPRRLRRAVRDAGFDSVTQYELWKAIWSGLNDGNFLELDWALQRHNEFLDAFAPQTFIGNHDVTRIATQLDVPPRRARTGPADDHRRCADVYAGDEFGFTGREGGTIRRRRRRATRIRLSPI